MYEPENEYNAVCLFVCVCVCVHVILYMMRETSEFLYM